MTEQQRLRALLILSAMQETIAKVQRDFAELQKAADEFRADMAEVLLRLRSDNATEDRGNGFRDRARPARDDGIRDVSDDSRLVRLGRLK